jgi:hypothetical protein
MHVCGGRPLPQEDKNSLTSYCGTMAAIFFLDVRLGQNGGLLQRRTISLVISLEMDPLPEVLPLTTLMMIKSVGTNGEEHVSPPQAALAPLLPRSAPILLVLVDGLGCTLVVVENPRRKLLCISPAAREAIEQGESWFGISTLGISRHGER